MPRRRTASAASPNSNAAPIASAAARPGSTKAAAAESPVSTAAMAHVSTM